MRRLISTLATLTLLTACGTEQPTPPANTLDVQSAATRAADGGSLGADIQRDLATLRRVTAPFHEFATAHDAGWATQITPCMTDPGGAGGMGFHYGNTDYIDGTAQVERPQLLLYEPEQNGKLRLVAVEYIIPYTFHARSAEAPVLFGQKFKQVDAFQLWGLHAWVWKENASGIFADWNPAVNCDNTTARMSMSH
jgi:hypothetical protein